MEGRRVIGSKGQHAAKARPRRRQPAERLESQAAIAKRARVVRQVTEQGLQRRERGIGPGLLQQQIAELQERVEVSRLGVEDRDVEALGGGGVASAPRIDRAMQGFGDGQRDGRHRRRPCRGRDRSNVIAGACRQSSRVVF